MNVRWDAVVDKKPFVRASAGVPDATATAPEAAHPAAPVEIEVWLFGMLAGPRVTNPVKLQFAEGCSVRDVIDELGRRLGAEFLRTVASDSGQPFNTCRMFLEGELVTDMTAPICSDRAAATVEIILFREIEGG